MPKRKLGPLSNLGSFGNANTKRVRLGKEKAAAKLPSSDKENNCTIKTRPYLSAGATGPYALSRIVQTSGGLSMHTNHANPASPPDSWDDGLVTFDLEPFELPWATNKTSAVTCAEAAQSHGQTPSQLDHCGGSPAVEPANATRVPEHVAPVSHIQWLTNAEGEEGEEGETPADDSPQQSDVNELPLTDYGSDSDDESVEPVLSPLDEAKLWQPKRQVPWHPPTVEEAKAALVDVTALIHPRRGAKAKGYKKSTLQEYVVRQLEDMAAFLRAFSTENSPSFGQWMAASEAAGITRGRGKRWAINLRKKTREFISDREAIPGCAYGVWTMSVLERFPSLADELTQHLFSCGKYVQAEDICRYMADELVLRRYGLERAPSLTTAQRWMPLLKFRWRRMLKGMYKDVHERQDVVSYRQEHFLPRWNACAPLMRTWDLDTNTEVTDTRPPSLRPTVAWFHDESIFYQNDRRQAQWVHDTASAVPLVKGEGASLMVADFVSADYGWLRSDDGATTGRRFLRPGKNRDGYQTNEDVITHATEAISIMKHDHPDDDHLLVFDNAPVHLKRSEDALSARKMPKKTPKLGTNWGVEVTERNATGQPVYNPDGTLKKIKIPMGNATFADGSPQNLYFPAGHKRAGIFKGMAEILVERGFANAHDLRTQCHQFRCSNIRAGLPGGPPPCCCRRALFNQPDFVAVKPLLQLACEERGVECLFLPKFHPELNPIEQCWGRAKRYYRLLPPSLGEADVQPNVIASLDSVTLLQIRRYSTRSQRFMNAYQQGLNGDVAAWAAKKFRGHRVVPHNIIQLFNSEN